MADMFLKLEGVEGESTDGSPLEDEDGNLIPVSNPLRKKHDKEIEIEKWNWHFENNASNKLTQQEAASKTTVHPITITKAIDKSSVTLVHYCTVGRHISKAIITCRKNAGDGDKVEYMIVEMKDVMVKDITWEGNDRAEPTGSFETVTLSFEEFKIIYTPQTNRGYGDKPVDYGFNIAHHRPV